MFREAFNIINEQKLSSYYQLLGVHILNPSFPSYLIGQHLASQNRISYIFCWLLSSVLSSDWFLIESSSLFLLHVSWAFVDSTPFQNFNVCPVLPCLLHYQHSHFFDDMFFSWTSFLCSLFWKIGGPYVLYPMFSQWCRSSENKA